MSTKYFYGENFVFSSRGSNGKVTLCPGPGQTLVVDTPRGQLQETQNLSTGVFVVDTYKKILNTTSASSLLHFESTVQNRLTYLGTSSIIVAVSYTVSMFGSSSTYTMGISVNGDDPSVHTETTVSAGTTNTRSASKITFIEFQPGDFIEVFIKNITSTTAVTVNTVSLSIL